MAHAAIPHRRSRRSLCCSLGVALLLAAGVLAPARAEAAAPPPQVLYVSPDGQGHACIQTNPCDLVDAQLRVRQLDTKMSSDIVVQLADGTYRLDAPLTLTAADSGSNGHQVVWEAAPGARPVLSGGRRITHWSVADAAKGIWAAHVPATLHTRQLYVDGVRAPIAQGAPPVALTRSPGGFTAADSTYASWRNPTGIEFVFTGGNGAWTESRCRVASIQGRQVTMQQPCWDNVTDRPQPPLQAPFFFPNLASGATPNRIENAYELLHAGQWYLDDAQHILYYIPVNGVDPNGADIEAPALQTLVTGDGTLENPVHDIVLRGLQFSYATWLAPSSPDGFAEIQTNIRITGDQRAQPQGTCNFTVPAGTCPFGANAQDPGNVAFRAAHNITIEGDTFTHLGAAGLAFGFGSQHNLVRGNTFSDISGIGISLGNTNDPHPSDVGADDREIDLGNTIADNYIHDIGAEYSGADGIFLLYTQQTTVTHNQISDVPWDGIDSGANGGHIDFGTHPDVVTNVNADNTISDNLIFNYHNVLSDGGAIYLEGHQGATITNTDGTVDEDASFAHGTQVTGNVVFGEGNGVGGAAGGDGWALYDDIGSQWITWRDNVEFGNAAGNGGCASIGHIRFIDNYHAEGIGQFPCAPAADLQYSDNTQLPLQSTDTDWALHMSPGDLPQAVLATNAGLEPAFQHLAGPPRIDEVSPRSTAPVTTPTQVLIMGTGFVAGMSVSFGNLPASDVRVFSSVFAIATAPPGAMTDEATVTTPQGSYTGPSGLPLADVTADSMDSEAFWHISFDPLNVVDHNLTSFWSSAETAQPHWIEVHFTHPITLGKVIVRTRRFPGMVITDATVSTAIGGGPLEQQASVSGNSQADIPFPFVTSQTVDTVRVTVNAETYQGAPRIEADIAELEFYDADGHLLGHG